MTGKPQGALLEFKVFLLVFHRWSAEEEEEVMLGGSKLLYYSVLLAICRSGVSSGDDSSSIFNIKTLQSLSTNR